MSKDDALRSVDQFCFPDIDSWKPVLSYQRFEMQKKENYKSAIQEVLHRVFRLGGELMCMAM